jgi:hypothetical protein
MFSPDLIMVTGQSRSKRYIEVKGINRQTAGHILSTNQLENYAYLLLRRLKDDGQPHAAVDYALFRYGPTRETPFDRISKLTYTQAMEKLAAQTYDLSIVPFNVLLLLAKAGRSHARDQTNSGSSMNVKREIHLRGSHLSALSENKGGLERVMEDIPRGLREELYELLCLDDVQIAPKKKIVQGVCRINVPECEVEGFAKLRDFTRYSGKPQQLSLRRSKKQSRSKEPRMPAYLDGLHKTSEGKYYVDTPVQPFSVVQVKNASTAWNTSFANNHGRILRLIGLENLYHTCPF